MDVDNAGNECCVLCSGALTTKPKLTVIVTLNSGWQVWPGVCVRCFEEEWREFKNDYDMAKGLKQEDRFKLLHALHVQYCDTLAVQVGRKVMKKTGYEILSAEPRIVRDYARLS